MHCISIIWHKQCIAIALRQILRHFTANECIFAYLVAFCLHSNNCNVLLRKQKSSYLIRQRKYENKGAKARSHKQTIKK